MQADHIVSEMHKIEDSVSYWHKTSHAQIELFTELPSRVDVVVIGAGILGVATCYWLAKAGVNVALLERSMAGYGATGRNGGFVTIGTAESHPATIERFGRETAHAILHTTFANRTLLKQILAEEEIGCDYREPGYLTLALNTQQLEALQQTTLMLQADGADVTMLDRGQVQDGINTPLAKQIVGGMFMPALGLVHSARLVRGLLNAARRYGAQTCLTTVQQLMPERTGLLVQTSRGPLHASSVVVATNAWTDEIVPELAGLVRPVRGQALAYEPIEPVFSVGMGASVTTTGEYWQQTLDGSIVLGGCRSYASGGDMGVRSSQPTREVQVALEQVLPHLFPALSSLRVMQRWAGLMAFTPDYLPIADRVQNMPGVCFGAGFNGHGMPFVIRLGQLLAEAVTSKKTPADLAPFRLDRPTLG